ncbi:undecaprenyl-diphosphate phosphatase [Portibacter marinus]|uniref:undecaprenyl-diphosphate phosphatase n=1 Tax=Portibacter marinus TaxID=2898660 RepID=UPI001F36D42D|nr:undecaprenyl-diphosphate phosphatase [Portibacter marinus]
MELIKAAILGIVQGLTEFLPVSSSGHLELFKYFLNDDAVGEESLLMTVVLHFATALSTIVVFRQTVWELIKGLLKFKWNKETQFTCFVILSMVPAVVVGLFFEDQLESLFNKNIILVALMLMITGLLLFVADRAKQTDRSLNFTNALVVGIAQAIAILPGISRSGATISTSVLLGLDRETAARFSFLMVLPLIFGKIAKDLLDGSFSANAANMAELGIGFLSAFVTGLFACTLMIKIVRKSQLKYFSYYCFAVAIISLLIYLL